MIRILLACTALLCGCEESKKHLPGVRQEIIVTSLTIPQANSPSPSIASPVINTTWEQTIINSSHSYAPIDFSFKAQKLWEFQADYPVTRFNKIACSHVCSNEKLFFVDAGGIVYALDCKTGKKIWSTTTTIKNQRGQIGCALAYVNNKLIVSTSFAECFCFDANSGKTIWRIKLPTPCKGDGITIHDSKIYLMCFNNELRVINQEDGSLIWSKNGVAENHGFLGSQSVAISNGLIFVGYNIGDVCAIQLETSSTMWDSIVSKVLLENVLSSIPHIRACPVVHNGVVYFVSQGGQLAAFQASTGMRLWDRNIGGFTHPSINGDSLFIINQHDQITCLDKSDGNLRWTKNLRNSNVGVEKASPWYGQLMCGEYFIAISMHGEIIGIDYLNGTIKFRHDIGKKVSVNPIITKDVMYILCDDGKVIAYK